MSIDDMYTNQYWQDLIETIVNRIGPDKFLLLVAAVLKDLDPGMSETIIEYDKFNREHDGDMYNSGGREKDEWKHEAVEAMKLKR